MATLKRSKRLVLMAGWLCVFPVGAFAAGPADAPTESAVFFPDDPASLVTIDGPWAQPLVIRIVTVSDVPAWTALIDPDATPDQPQRIATVIRHPVSGDLIDINLVETTHRVVTVLANRGRSRSVVETIVNNERPFTRDAQWQALSDGRNIRQPNDGAYPTGDRAVGWSSGRPVVEIPVWFDAERSAFTDYAIQIVSPTTYSPSQPPNTRRRPPGKEGGDPGGNPDPPTLKPGGTSGQESGSGDDGDDGDGGDGGEGGDPGGNPDPPNQDVGN